MSKRSNQKTRRDFFAGTGAAAGAMAFASVAGAAEDAKSVEINAMMPTPEQMQAYMSLDHDGPVVMVNLLKFKPDGGAAEYAKYGAAVAPILKKIGARILFSGQARVCLIGNGDWDAVALVEYPNKMALVKMAQSPEYQAIHHHREAGLAGQVNYAVVQSGVFASD